jgi:methyl-accepting chemotaxis protein
MVRALFQPAAGLMGRLPYARKFLLIGVVLLAPLAFVTQQYVTEKNAQEAFSALELDGVAYVAPASELLGKVVAARSAAVAGQPVDAGGLNAAAARLAEVDADLGQALETSALWEEVRTQLQQLATGELAPVDAYAEWSAAAGKVRALIVQAADKSNLTLDPDLDTYYLMDTLITKLPTLADTAGQAADLRVAAAGGRAVPGVDSPRIELAVLLGTVSNAASAVDANLKVSIETTADDSVEGRLGGPIGQLDQAVETVVTEVDKAVKGSLDGDLAGARTRAGQASAAAVSLAGEVAPALDGLIDTRIGGFASRERTVETVVAIAVALALWLFVGFYLSVTRSVRGTLGVLAAAADGDLTQSVERHTTDEVGRMGDALGETLERIRGALASITRCSQDVASQSEQLGGLAERLTGMTGDSAAEADKASQAAAAAQEDVTRYLRSVATSSQQMTEAINEIARSTADAASKVGQAVTVTERTTQVADRLERSSNEIADVLKLISSIAEQTNLLALNATIEAARAGESGKGFAVVAGEVKELAQETAKATEDIARKIDTIRSVSTEVTSGVAELSTVMAQINDTQTTIAGAVEQQSATTAEIGRGVAEAAEGSERVAGNLASVATATRDTNQVVGETERAAAELARVAEELRTLTGSFRS